MISKRTVSRSCSVRSPKKNIVADCKIPWAYDNDNIGGCGHISTRNRRIYIRGVRRSLVTDADSSDFPDRKKCQHEE